MDKVIILNRRCIKHPEKGGAEIYTYHLAKALIEAGKSVEWFSSKFDGSPAKEHIDGITFIRKGNEFTTHFFGFLYALKSRESLIIDEFNGIGFFTSSLKNSILLIHQLYEEFWTAQMGFLGFPFKYIEKLALWLYRKKPVITVSNSTTEDLKFLGFNDIHIIHNGLEIEQPIHQPKKNNVFSLVYLGRLKKTKNPEDAIKAFLLIRKHISNAEMTILGNGPLMDSLKTRYKGVDGLLFRGYVDEKEKLSILMKSHFLLVPSIREGWGQVVIQANAVGTPAIGYDIPGLRDSIIDGFNGKLVRDYREMAEVAINLYINTEEYKKMVIRAIEWSKNFSWNKTKREFIDYLERRGFI